MIKRRVGEQFWLVRQPDHAQSAAFLAAHWGNGEFARPGQFNAPSSAEYWRDQTIFAIAEHDNGWWEWEANPAIDPDDHLPLDFLEIGKNRSMAHWRIGTNRFAESHPFAALLICLHSRLLYESVRDDPVQPQLIPPLMAGDGSGMPSGGEPDELRDFVAEQKELESKLLERATEAAATETTDLGNEELIKRYPKRGIPPDLPLRQDDFLMPHVRLLQIADSLSLTLCRGGAGPRTIDQVPRRSWEDRVTLELEYRDGHGLALSPYPFDQDPLKVSIPAWIIPAARPAHDSFLTWSYQNQRQLISFQLSSA